MQSQFHISVNKGNRTSENVLAVQLGVDYFAYAIIDPAENILIELQWFELQTGKIDALQSAMNSNILQETFSKKIIAFDFPVYTLLPAFLNTDDNTALLHLLGADSQDHVMHETIANDMALIYTVPFSMLNWSIQHFTGATYWHLQSLRVINALPNNEGDALHVNFINNHFQVITIRNQDLLLAQSYKYRSPTDVLFYLLKICQTYNMQQEKLQVHITGLVDETSALYKLLYEYFLHIHIKAATWLTEENHTPLHYFTTLQQVSLCVSYQEN